MRAAFKAVMDGKQVAVLVPTTVLAQQHFNTFRERLAAFPVRRSRCSRASGRDRRAARRSWQTLAAGAVDIVIGTHRLLQKDVTFKDLGLVIIDEEQRFGVAHKERLKKMRSEVDVLTLTATPIPRTLYMALDRHPRHVDDRDAAGGAPADQDVRPRVRRTTWCARRSCASWSAAGRSSSCTTACTTSPAW